MQQSFDPYRTLRVASATAASAANLSPERFSWHPPHSISKKQVCLRSAAATIPYRRLSGTASSIPARERSHLTRP